MKNDNKEYRDINHVINLWNPIIEEDIKKLQYEIKGPFWENLNESNKTIFITREYEHLVIAITIKDSKPFITYMKLPHPSGIAFNKKNKLSIACTRNPNQIIHFNLGHSFLDRTDVNLNENEHNIAAKLYYPTTTHFYPGAFYLHDLQYINSTLFGTSVGQNSIVSFENDGTVKYQWHPNCVLEKGQPRRDINFLQLNSIASNSDLSSAYFSASTDRMEFPRPGEFDFNVKEKGVIFSAATGEPAIKGLTRPHSAIFDEDKIIVANSGYGEVLSCNPLNGEKSLIAKLNGWTRGIEVLDKFYLAGSSKVLKRFSHYAPGLDDKNCECGIHFIDKVSGQILSSLKWPTGNQIFSIRSIDREISYGFPYGNEEVTFDNNLNKLFYLNSSL